MNEPTGELVELDFYFGNQTRKAAFSQIVRYCCAHGSKFAGEIWETKSEPGDDDRFRYIGDRRVFEIEIDANELDRKLLDPRIDIVKVALWSAIGVTDECPEVVAYNGVSDEASYHDNPTVALVSKGWVFSTPDCEQEAAIAGKRCYERLIAIANALDPDYAAILNEDSLPCPYELARGAGTRCFANFFVSERAYGRKTIAAIEALYSDAYTERIATGVYASTSPVYNPAQFKLDYKVRLERSQAVARMLGAHSA
jgi:hypothetical protein